MYCETPRGTSFAWAASWAGVVAVAVGATGVTWDVGAGGRGGRKQHRRVPIVLDIVPVLPEGALCRLASRWLSGLTQGEYE